MCGSTKGGSVYDTEKVTKWYKNQSFNNLKCLEIKWRYYDKNCNGYFDGEERII